jgi:hypothetical protein
MAGSAGSSSDGGGSDGGSSDGATDGGSDGATDGGPVTTSRPGMDMVAGGVHAKSANFTIILTLGESPGGNGLAKSTLYEVRGGLVSSTQR